MPKTLITGANKGLGHETARQLVAAGHTVYVGARNPMRGRAAAMRIGARFVELDVTNDASAAAIAVAGGLDVLINNAGVVERTPAGRFLPAADETGDSVRSTFETNVVGVVRMIQAFLPLLERSNAPVIVNVSSGLSLTRDLIRGDSPTHAFPGIGYPASKAALNSVTVQYAKAYPDIRINAAGPGFTATELNCHTGRQSVEEGAEIIVRLAQISPDGPSGGFFDLGGSIPW
ncbi:MAG: SDR family NAD(P)-dependent oxidoreductase [Mycobacterium sp.]|nr:SDR family NAD(P)-dependent oxidoreductase [Mycobacterium sp.]